MTALSETENPIMDQAQREAALDIQHSFIVQAPAGSGKTELLTRRYLALLKHCRDPEEILAITFTRKAAAEMRARVLSALGTTENPQRLRILTIDALCAQISSRLPLLSGFGGSAKIVENAQPYYRQAIHAILTDLTPDQPWTKPVKQLLTHLDNRVEKLVELFIDMLSRREQWLPYIIPRQNASIDLRRRMEQSLQHLVEETLTAAQIHLTPEFIAQLSPLSQFAAINLLENQTDHPLTDWAQRTEWPPPDSKNFPAWLGIAQLLLTQKGEWRRRIDKNLGFPAKTAEKSQLESLLEQLSSNEILLNHLKNIQECPPLHYTEAQWEMISVLIHLLPLLAAQLQLIFQQHGVMDFIELNLAASKALGEEDSPTDLALALDYRLKHLLVDEFQDTSESQRRLLEKLMAGWEPGDGRTVFLVGDPMQSIYRFRNAEVALFLRAQEQGIGPVLLLSLTLQCNFRSQKNLVAWFNQAFPCFFPAEADRIMGAVPYTPSAAVHSSSLDPAVSCYPLFSNDIEEAKKTVEIVRQCREQDPNGTIAILVRSRSHLSAVIPALQAADIRFQATEIESLRDRAEIQDLLALTRALHHRADRIAWLAVLRAPYCGLSLADLQIIAQNAVSRTIYEALLDFSQLANLSENGKRRLERVVPVLSHALFNQGRDSAVEWIEHTWLSLGGPAGLDNETQLQNTQTFFQLLRALVQENGAFNQALLDDRLRRLYAAPDMESDGKLQVMTIHKAKGLEFDHIILPALNRKPPPDASRLLLWLERPNTKGGSDLILAPIKDEKSAEDSVYAYLKKIEQKKLAHEMERLLYVAITRAKHSLHLLSVAPSSSRYGFLALLWPYFEKYFQSRAETDLENPLSPPVRWLRRLVADWQSPFHAAPDLKSTTFDQPVSLAIPALRASFTGTVIHEALATLAEQAPRFPDGRALESLQAHWRRRFIQLGLPQSDLEEALLTVHEALLKTLQDPRGLWILSDQHTEQENEFALSTVINHQMLHVIIDRTFVDADGVRWIIDYKTGAIEDLENYQTQLKKYAEVLALKDNRPIRLGLYFPLFGGWREWSVE